jgi:predicted nucleic acid-binding Zn ribbon protein
MAEAEEGAGSRCALCGKEVPEGGAVCEECRRRVNEKPSEASAFPFTPINHFLVTLLVIAWVSAVVYRYIQARQLVETYAMFVGIPLIIGVLCAYTLRPRNSFGLVMKLTTVLICVVAPILGEGMICLLMAAPILYAVAALGYLLAAALDRWFNPPGGRGGVACLLLLPFLFAELTTGPQGIRNGETLAVSDERFVAARPERAWHALRHGELISPDVPLFLRLGFPLPTRLERLPDGETRLNFDPRSAPRQGTNVIVSRRVTDEQRRRLSFFILEDGTGIARWLMFLQTRFEVEAVPGGCRVRQTTIFRRRLQPGVYWRPLQCFAVSQMHDYALVRIQELAEKPAP